MPVQSLSFESWPYTMWNVTDAEGLASGWYFAALIVMGSFLLLNAFIAGISFVFMILHKDNQVGHQSRKCACIAHARQRPGWMGTLYG